MRWRIINGPICVSHLLSRYHIRWRIGYGLEGEATKRKGKRFSSSFPFFINPILVCYTTHSTHKHTCPACFISVSVTSSPSLNETEIHLHLTRASSPSFRYPLLWYETPKWTPKQQGNIKSEDWDVSHMLHLCLCPINSFKWNSSCSTSIRPLYCYSEPHVYVTHLLIRYTKSCK